MALEEYKSSNPSRQGFYKVRTQNGEKLIAEWREHDKKEGKRWWAYVSEDPTVEKTRVPLDGVKDYAKVEKYEVEVALKRSLTRTERIDASLDAYYKSRDTSHPFHRTIPANRLLQVGQEVIMGNLREARVAAIHADGQIITIEHRSVETKFGKEIDRGLTLGTWYWLDVLPKTPAKATDLALNPAFSSQAYFNTQLEHLIRRGYRDGVSDNPDYQRDYVWTPHDKALLLDALFSGRPVGRFIFVKEKYPKADVLFDGKQRMNTLLELVSSVLPYKGVYWHEMSPKDRNTVMNRSVQFAELDAEQYSRADLLDIFLEVNAAGVPQTEEHLAKVRAMRDAERAKEATLQS